LCGNDGFQDWGVVGNDESIHTETCTTSFPRKWESRISGFQSFPIDSRRVRGLDSRLRGNDEFRDCGIVGNGGFQDYGVVGNDGFQDYGVVGNDGLGISTPAPRL
ncbi:TPA: hypothetical protein ACJJ69_002068, partial [Neisseria meningitidis]